MEKTRDKEPHLLYGHRRRVDHTLLLFFVYEVTVVFVIFEEHFCFEKRLAALAHVWLVGVVDGAHVFLEVRQLVERFVGTDDALEGFLPGVATDVHLQGGGVRERHVADLAAVRADAAVNALVHGELRALHEPHVAVRARVWLLLHVSTHVLHQVPLVLPVADLTLRRLYVSMIVEVFL